MGYNNIYIANYIRLYGVYGAVVHFLKWSTFCEGMKKRIEANTIMCYNATVEIWIERSGTT